MNKKDKNNENKTDRREKGYFEKMREHMRIPSGCEACGGPYPACKGGCPVFDDEE